MINTMIIMIKMVSHIIFDHISFDVFDDYENTDNDADGDVDKSD